MFKTTTAALSVVLLMSGCSSMFDIDKDISKCSITGKGRPCVSARAAYYASQDYDPEAELVSADTGRGKKHRRGRNTVSPFHNEPLHADGAGYPRPMMNPAKVMRVWINSYEDADGNLVYPTRVYTEVGQKKWDVGYSLKRSETKIRRVTPLVAKPAENPVAEKTANEMPENKTGNHAAPQNNSANPIPDTLPQGLVPPLQ
ncbi:TraV family lipoprotein [Neisseria sp.]|uniref:TraV family lipoprotein n=1 Tax=Neisseria sp. TaxID=192066 RepID=UPI0035A15151